MALVVEDGTGLSNANSYLSEGTADDYHEDRGNSAWSDGTSVNKEAALIRATAYIDGVFRSRFPGYRVNLRDQALEWPRSRAYDVEGNLIDGTSVPTEIVQATAEAALRELATPGSTMPDLERGGQITSLQAGSVAITYGSGSSPYTTYSLISGILSRILGGSTPYSARATRT